MPTIVQKTVYHFDELSDEAKEKAREWYRQNAFDYEWWDCIYEDFSRICKLIGIELDIRPIRLMNGGTRYEPKVYFSGFWSQGDGACFFGRYDYQKGALKAVEQYAPQDITLYGIVRDLQEIQKKYFYQLSATITERSSIYCHSGTMQVTVYRNGYDFYASDAYETIRKCMRNLADWLYYRLKAEYEWLQSDESVDEGIIANEYTFDEYGNIEY